MKYIIVAIVLISGVLSAPAPQESSAVSQVADAAATIVRYFFDWYPNNEGYRYTYVISRI